MKWMKRAVTAILVLAAICGGGYLIYENMMGYGKLSEEERLEQQEKENSINGQWQAGGTLVCDIWRDEDGIFHGAVTRAESDNAVSFWDCSGAWSDAEGGFTYRNGTRFIMTYPPGGETGDGETETVYEDGKGAFYLKDGKVYWDDDEEHTADGQPFDYIGEY